MYNVVKMEFEKFSDNRGNLVAMEFPKNLPFSIERIYYIYDVLKDKERGFHSHRDLEQILICLGGSVKIRVKDGTNEEIITLNNSNEGLYMGPMIWREMFEFSENATLLVLASKRYNELDYIRDYDKYVKEAKQYFRNIMDMEKYQKGKSIDLKLAEIKDAKFLLDLRTNKNLNTYLSQVGSSLKEQENWLTNYKIREFNKKEYYFKTIDKNNKNIGFARLYNIDYDNKELTFGSFIMGENKTKYAALETMILLMQISFRYLKMDKVLLDVRKNNLHAKEFYTRFRIY